MNPMNARPFRTALKRVALGTVGVGFPVIAFVGYRHRPRHSDDVDFHERLRDNAWEPNHPVEAFVYNIGRTVVLAFVTNVLSTVLHRGSDIDYVDKEKLERFVSYDRPGGVPLVTVANHSSTFDDPGLMSAIMPTAARWQHRRMRWAICTEEICFSNPGLGSFFGMGKALAVRRGGSIYQKGIATLQQKLNSGDWVHVFPEGRCWQEGGAPLRDSQGRWCSASGRCGPPWQKVGPFKWGVGKLVANSSQVPLVVPIFHCGMADIIPQGHDNQIVSGPHLASGKKVTVMVGDPVPVVDLLEAYHEGARQRAEERNRRRMERLRALEEGGAKEVQEAKTGWAGWWAWLWPWARTPSQPTPSVPASLPRPVISSLRPVNTVEDFSDHSGASAHIAGTTLRVTETEARQVVQQELAKDKDRGSSDGPSAGLGLMTRAADEVIEETRAATRRMSEAAANKGEALRQQAEELVSRLRELERSAVDTLRAVEGEVARVSEEYAARLGIEQELDRVRQLAAEGEEKAKSAARELRREVAEVVESATASLPDSLRHPFSASVSVPRPSPIRVPTQHKHTIALPKLGEGEGSSSGAREQGPGASSTSTSTPPSSSSPSGPHKASSSDPLLQSMAHPGSHGEDIVELVPTRKLSTGVVIPAYVEPPLRIRPPDHEYLTPGEAQEEEGYRLQLYSDIAARLQDGVAQLEAKVMARRAAQGIVESRAMS